MDSNRFIKTKEEYDICNKNVEKFYQEIGMKSGDKILPYFVTANIISKKQINLFY